MGAVGLQHGICIVHLKGKMPQHYLWALKELKYFGWTSLSTQTGSKAARLLSSGRCGENKIKRERERVRNQPG